MIWSLTINGGFNRELPQADRYSEAGGTGTDDDNVERHRFVGGEISS